MTRFDPTLIVKRVVVQRGDRVAYDEPYHAGVNVIRGENSSGKSTILNLIMYGLGGDLTDWSDAAKLCTRIQIEGELNGNVATLSREISTDRGRPMEIFGGDFEISKKAPRDEWIRYPYARSPSKESFSQALFRLLGIPEVASEVSGNITIHQILRLLYADQLSPVESLFKSDNVYDSPLIRDAVGRLLCGAYDGLLYQNQIQIRELQREFDTISGELRSLFAVASEGKDALTMDWIEAQRRVLEEQRHSLQAEIEEAERRLFVSGDADELTLKVQEQAYTEVQRVQEELGAIRQERDKLVLNIADSASFIASLEGVVLHYTILVRANLYRANLSGTAFFRANLQSAVMSYANLQGAAFYTSYLQFADLSGADLEGAAFFDSELWQTKLDDETDLGLLI